MWNLNDRQVKPNTLPKFASESTKMFYQQH